MRISHTLVQLMTGITVIFATSLKLILLLNKMKWMGRFYRVSRYIEHYPVTLKDIISYLHYLLVTVFPVNWKGLRRTTCIMSRTAGLTPLLKLEDCNLKLLRKPELLASCWREIPSTITCKLIFKSELHNIELCGDQSCGEEMAEYDEACLKMHVRLCPCSGWPLLHLRTKKTTMVYIGFLWYTQVCSFLTKTLLDREQWARSNLTSDKCRGKSQAHSA